MVEHAGVGCALSLAIVAGFAILLHEQPVVPPMAEAAQPAPADTPAEPPARVVLDAKPPARVGNHPEPSPPPPPPPPQTLADHPAPPPTRPASAPNSSRRASVALIETAAVVPRPSAVPAPAAALAPAPARRRAEPERPRIPASSFAEVLADETLAEVAVRVYGTARVAENLWRANRDQVVDRSGALVAGTWLRTPPCGDD